MDVNPVLKVKKLYHFYQREHDDFDEKKAIQLLHKLKIKETDQLKNMSKGTKEKVQLVMVMSRKADLYILDEPIGGVDPASRDYILETILTNFNEGSSILISTHLISDIEKILDQVIFINQGKVVLNEDADTIRKKKKTTIDKLFREEFKC